MVCDSFRVNLLLVSPDKSWIAAGTTDNSDFSPKVLLVVFKQHSLLHFILHAFCLLLRYLWPTKHERQQALTEESSCSGCACAAVCR